jgi:hypothetical protein
MATERAGFFKRLFTLKPNKPLPGFIVTVHESKTLSYSLNKEGWVVFTDGTSQDAVPVQLLQQHRIDALVKQLNRKEVHEGLPDQA